MTRNEALAARLWPRVILGDGCWEWTGPRNPNGYGTLAFEGRPQRAHRAAWEVSRGPIPAGAHVLHRCDNPPCVRPDHLFLGSNKDNVADRHAKGRDAHNKGESGGRAKLKNQDIYDIRAAAARGAGLGDLARRYRLNHGTVWAVVHRRSWKHLPSPKVRQVNRG